MKQNAAQFAVAGGAALVAFGAKAVSAFADLGIEAGKLSDALGMPVEDASRLMEVAGDLGIETKALESTIGRMNRTAADTPGAFDDIGAAIVRNADGTVNVNETFLSTVDALNKIPDATERASAAQKIFGRSWMDIAELVGQGADDVRASLDSVSDAKVIDESEVQKAREFRAAMDRFKDSIEDITLAVGEGLIPIVSSGTEGIAAMVEVADKLKLIDLAGWFSSMTNPISQFNRVLATARGEADLFGRSVTSVNDEQMSFVQAAKDAGVAGSEVKAARGPDIRHGSKRPVRPQRRPLQRPSTCRPNSRSNAPGSMSSRSQRSRPRPVCTAWNPVRSHSQKQQRTLDAKRPRPLQ